MSDASNTSSMALRDTHHPLLLPTTAPTSLTGDPSPSFPRREYRKGNWTLQETMVLIDAKKMDDERLKSKQSGRTAENRWKWVENYCWRKECFRSQNQCNDKWDNLLRDYKKVRDYVAARSPSLDRPSYWQIEKHERKERNLPSNLRFDVFQALDDVVNRRCAQKSSAPDTSAAAIARPSPPQAPAVPSPPPAPAQPPPPQPPLQSPVSAEMTDSSETERSERVDSETKRRKVRNVGSSLVRGAQQLARTMLACEEKKEKRHQDVLELEERKLQMEEKRNQMNRQGIDGLITAVNNLSNAIHALVSHQNETSR